MHKPLHEPDSLHAIASVHSFIHPSATALTATAALLAVQHLLTI